MALAHASAEERLNVILSKILQPRLVELLTGDVAL